MVRRVNHDTESAQCRLPTFQIRFVGEPCNGEFTDLPNMVCRVNYYTNSAQCRLLILPT